MNELIGSGNIENDWMELEEYQQKLAYLDSPEITNYGNPEKIARAKEIANRAIEQINRRIRQKQNIQATVQNDIEAMNEAHKAKRQQERAEMNPVERGFNAIKDYSLKTPLLAGELASNIALGGGGFLARSAGNLTGWKGLETIGEKTMQANRDFKNLLDIENSLPSYFEGTTDHEWNSVGGATQNVIGGVGKFMEGYHEFAPLGIATSGVGAGIGMAGKALGAGEKAVKTAQAAANLGLFASSNVANTSDYIEQTSGKFKPIQSGVSSAASALAMEIAFALGRGRGMNDVEASNYATRMLNENQFVMMSKKAFKQSFTTAIANGFLNGVVGTWLREEFALPDNATQEDYDRLASNVWEAIKHETAQGAIWGGFGAVQYHNEVRKLFNQLGGKKTITTPDGKKRSVYKTNASAKFILENSEKLQKEKFPNLFEKGSIKEVNSYLDELFKSVPEKLILGKSAEFGEQKENFKAALLREYNLAFVEYSSAFNSNNRFAPKIRNAKENKEAQTVNSLMANKVKGLYSQYVAAKTAIKNIDIEIEASKEDLQKQQELARQKEELQSKSYALTTQLEKPYSVYEMVGFIRNALEKQYGQIPEFMKRVDDVLSKYMGDNWHTPISADEAMGVYNQITGELSKLDTRNVYDDYNSKINNIVNFGQPTVYGNDERNIPSSVMESSYQEPKQLGYDGVIYGNDERGALPESRQLGYDGAIYPEMVNPLDRTMPLSVRGNEKPILPGDVVNEQNRIRSTQSPAQSVNEFPVDEYWYPSNDYKERENTPPSVRTKNGRESLGIKDNIKSEPSVQLNDKTIAEMKNNGSLNIEQAPNGDYFVTGRLDNGQPIVASGLDLDTASKVITSLRETKELQNRPKMDMPRDNMNISQPKEQLPINDRISGKSTSESPSSFKESTSSLNIPQASKSENVPPKNKMKIDSTDKIGSKAVRDSQSFDTRADMPQSVMTDRSESPAIKNERGKMGLNVEMKQKEAPKSEAKTKVKQAKQKTELEPETKPSAEKSVESKDYRTIDEENRKAFGVSDKTPAFKKSDRIASDDLRVSSDSRIATNNKFLIMMNEGEKIPQSKDKKVVMGEKLEKNDYKRVIPPEGQRLSKPIPLPYFKTGKGNIGGWDNSDSLVYVYKNGSAFLFNAMNGNVIQIAGDKGLPIVNGIPDAEYVFNGKYIETINKALGGDLRITHMSTPNYPIMLEGRKGKAVLMPMYAEGSYQKNISDFAYSRGKIENLTPKKPIDKAYFANATKQAKEYNTFKRIDNLETELSKLSKKTKGVDYESLHPASKAEYDNVFKRIQEIRDEINSLRNPEKIVKESRARNKATNPVSDKDLNNFLKGQAKQITKETGLNFKVVDSVDELSKIAGEQLDAKTEGGIQGDTVYIVRGNVDKERFPLLIAHEVAGHRGVEALFDSKEQMDSFFKSLERASDRDRFISDAFAEVDRLGYTKNRSREAMAKIVERVKAESGTLKGTAKTFVNFIASRVRRLLRRMGFKNLQLNEAEVYDLAVQALRRTGLKNSNKFFGLDRFMAKDNSFLSATSTELDKKYPNWLKDQNAKTGEHKTQISKTESTYRQIGEFLKKKGFKNAKVLDASSGLGYGTEALREMGFNVEDIEMNPSETKRKNNKQPTYKYVDYADIYKNHGKKYDVIINNAVLNVIPDDWRKSQLHAMADVLLNDGGKLFINVRDTKEIEDIKQKIELDSPREVLVTDKSGKKVDSYQRGFDQVELEHWLTKELGRGYTVEAVKESNSGLKKGTRAVVITKNSANANKTAKQVYDSITKRLSEKQLQNREKNNSAEPLSTLTTLQGSPIQRYKGNVGKEVNSQIYVHKDYAKEVVPNEILNKATQILAEKRPDFKYKTIMWDKDKGTVRFDEAPNFDTAPEPIPGLMVTVNPITGEVSDGYSQSIWHHKWEWVKDDYKGFDTRKSWERSREWLNGLANLNLDESDPYYLVAGKGAANGKALGYGAWNNQLMYYGLDHLIDDKNNFVPPESYRVAMERRQAAKAEKDAIKAAEKEAKLTAKKREQLDKLAEKAGYNIKQVFHGGTVDGSFDTNRGEGGAFGKGAYFTNGWGAANEYAKVRGGQTKEYYLKMQKPFDSREPLKDSKELNKLFDILKQRYNMEDWELRRIKEYGAGELSKQLTKHAKKEELSKGFWKGGDLTNSLLRESGFDGIIAPLDDYIDTYQYVIFNPEQAKLADSKSFQNPKGEFLASRPRTREEARSPKEFYGEKRWNAIKSYKKNKGVVDNLLPTIDEEMYEGYEKLPDGIQAIQNITNNGELLADLDHALRYHYKSDIIDTLNHIKERVAQTYDEKFADKIAKRCDRIIRMTEKGEYDASKIKPISLKELEKQKIKEMPKTDWDLDREYYRENGLVDPVTQTGHGWVQRGDGSYEWLSSIGEKSTIENVGGKRKVKPNLTDELAQKIIDEVGEVRNPKDYNAVKKIAKENMAEYKDLFSTKKNTGYKTAALKLHYLTGYKMKNREVEKSFRAIKDFNVLKKTAGAYIRNIIDDKSAQANLLDKVVKANSFEKVYDIITNTNIAKEKELRQNTLNDFVENMKNLKVKKVSSATYEAVQDIIDKNFTREELDGLLNTNEFTTKAVSKLRDLADGIASGLGSISKTDVEVAQWAIDNARKLKKGLNNLIQKREEGNTSLNVPVEKLAEVNTLLNRLYQQEKEARKALDTSLENAAVADKQKILAEAPEAKNPNSRDTYSLGTVKENLAPVTAVNSLDNDNITAKMGKTMHKVAYENLLEGQNRQDHYRAEGYKVVDDIYQSFGKNGDLRDGMNNLNETAMQVETSKGHKYDITKGEVLAAVATYMDSETRQIIDRAGGVDFFLGAKRDSDYFTLTTEKLKEMTDSLTPLEKKALKKGSRLLSQVFLPAINETHERLNGVPLRIREDGVYFPRFHVNLDESIGNGIINRDSAPYLHQQMNADYQAMLKQRNSKARPSLMLKSFPEVLNSYVDQGALYIGMAEPLRHLNRVMTEGMKRELISRYGKEYVDRITTLTKNMAGMAGRTDADRGLSNRFLSNIAAAKLTPISALKQFSSVPLASSIIDFKYLAKAALSGLSNENIKEMMELDSMVLRYRNNGIAGIIPLNTKTWEGERQLQKHSNKWYNKIIDTGLNLSVEADKRALGIIYKATKLMAEAKGKGNDKAWIEKTFMDAVRRTQNTTDLASANGWQMKSRESAHWSFLNMYQNQTQKIGNEAVRLYRGIKEAEKLHGKDSAQYKEAKGRAVDFAIGVAVMNVMAIGTGAVAGSILHKKDEKETTRQKVADFATDTMFNLTGNPILKPVMGGSSYVLRKSLPKALGGSAQRTQSEMFGNDFTNLVPDTIYTAGKIFEEINSDDPAAKKFRKITGEALRSKSFENGLAMGRVPTWFLRYPSQLYRKYFVDESKKTKSASTGSSGLRKYPIKRQRIR